VRSLIVVLMLATILVIFSGCVQPRFNKLESQNGGRSVSASQRHWWGVEQQSSDVDIDKFIYRWDGLLK